MLRRPDSRESPIFPNRNKGGVISSQNTRINDRIRISPVRLVSPTGEQLGIVPLQVAQESAREHGLDLVEVAPNARPPVVRIMDWGKHQYEEQKKARDSRRRQHTVEMKEVKFRPVTDPHDRDVKVNHARKFLESGKKVKVTVRYRGREMRRPELGIQILDEVARALGDVAVVETRSDRMEARQLNMVLAPGGSSQNRVGAGGAEAT